MTIDLDVLEGLLTSATKGPWVSQGRYIGTPNHMSYVGEVRDQNGNWTDTAKSRSDAALIVAAVNALPELIAAARERDAMREALDLWHAGKLTLTTMPDGRPCIMHHRDDPNAEIRDPDTGEVLFPAVKAPFRVIENEARQALNQEQPA